MECEDDDEDDAVVFMTNGAVRFSISKAIDPEVSRGLRGMDMNRSVS
jgi:hypothetical protein